MDYIPNVQTAAIKWGKTKEEIAIREYQNLMQKHNPGFVVRKSGLVINPAYSTLGVTQMVLPSVHVVIKDFWKLSVITSMSIRVHVK